MLDRQQLVDTLIDAFPDIRDDITDDTWSGLVHLEVSCFTRYTQAQIDAENRSELRRCFELARQFMLHGDSIVVNAMHVSYLEHLNTANGRVRRSWALAAMPEPLLSAYTTIHG